MVYRCGPFYLDEGSGLCLLNRNRSTCCCMSAAIADSAAAGEVISSIEPGPFFRH